MAPRKQVSGISTPSKVTSSTTATTGTTTSATSTTATTSTSSGSTTTPPISLRSAKDFQSILNGLWQNYLSQTPVRTKQLDVFMAFLVVVGALQFVYCLIGGNYPFNAFLSGFSATVGQFVLTASLRMQTNDANAAEFKGISHERAFADYVFGSVILHFFCVNFIN